MSRDTEREQGSALILAIFVLVLLATTGIVLMTLGQNEMKMGTASLQTKAVFYLAESGLEDGRATLLDNGLDLSASLTAAAGVNGVIDFDVDSVQPVFDGKGQFVRFDGVGDDVPLRVSTSNGVGQYMAFLSNDPIEADPLVDTNERVIVSGLATGPGESFEIVQALVEPEGLIPSIPPCAITLIGPKPDFKGGKADCPKVDPLPDDEDETDDTYKNFNGSDCDGTGVPDLVVPTVCTAGSYNFYGTHEFNATDEDEVLLDEDPDEDEDDDVNSAEAKTFVLAGLDDCPHEHIAGTFLGTDTIANLDDPMGEPMLGPDFTYDHDWSDCFKLLEVVEKVRQEADFVCVDSTCELDKKDDWNTGTEPVTAADTVMLADGDFKVTNDYVGNGLVVVTGAVEFEARASWNGAVLVLGEGEFKRKNDSDVGEISGAVVVANIAGPDGEYGTADDCTDGLYGFRPPIFHEGDGQRGDTNFCSSDIAAFNTVYTYEPR